MSKPKVFVTREIPAAGLAKVEAACDAEVWREPLPPPRSVLLEKAREVVGLLSLLTEAINEELLAAAPNLKVVSNYAVGYNNIDVAACRRRGVAVGNTPGVLTDATADLAFALLISAARRIVEGVDYGRDGKWKTWEPLGHIGQDLCGRTLGVVGMGRIGFALAKRCRLGWDMEILYCDPRAHADAEEKLGARKASFDELLATSDFVSVHADLNETTRGLFNADAFRKMKPTAAFINTARGPLHVEADLIAALKEKWIFAAGLDVTDPEPPDPANELLRLSNAIVVPHIASATVRSRDAMAEIAADNLLAGVAGKPLRCAVTT